MAYKTQRVLMLEAPQQVRLREMPLPAPGPNDVVVEPLVSSFKHGTEMTAYFGRSPFASRAFNPELRLFEAVPNPAIFYPRPMGNMMVGKVRWAGGNVQGLDQEQRVFAWAPVCDMHVLPASKVCPLGDLSPEQAVCIDPAAFALGATIDGAIQPSECVLVTGLGAIGLLVIQYSKLLGAKVIAASSFASRRELAEAFGADEVYDTRAHADLAHLIKQTTGGVDAAIECSGNLASLNLAIRANRQCGRVVCVGFYGPADSSLRLGEEFFHNRISLLASLPAHAWNNPVRGSSALYAKDLQQMAARDLADARITPRGILDPVVSFEEALRAVRLIAEEPHRVVKVLLDHSTTLMRDVMGHQPRIHVTFPVLNEEAQLADAVDRTASYCSSNGIPIYEFCIADNGSTDQTPQIGRMLEQRHANVRYLRVGRRGFGLALKSAWANTDADIVGYMDVDLATDLRHLKEVSDLFSSGAPYDLVLGSRLKQGASVENRSLLRELMSRGFNRLLQWRLGVSFSDAMCGFKFIDRKIYNALVNSFDFTDDWFFATQLAVRAEWIGARIFDMPVEWTDQPDSKSSARLLNLSLLYLAGISELRQEMQQFQKRLSETIPGQRGP